MKKQQGTIRKQDDDFSKKSMVGDDIYTAPLVPDQKKDSLEMMKEKCVSKVRKEVDETHPEEIPESLFSFFSQGLIKNPVITTDGKIYDEIDIKKWLETNTKDPVTKEKLNSDMLHPFPEIKPVINEFKKSLTRYKELKESLLISARAAIELRIDNENYPPQTPASIFVCPVSKKLMTHAMISRSGDVCDKTANSSENAVDFSEFNEYLKFYLELEKKVSLVMPTESNDHESISDKESTLSLPVLLKPLLKIFSFFTSPGKSMDSVRLSPSETRTNFNA